MPRIALLPRERVGRLTRLAYRLADRRLGQVPEPLRASAHHPGLMWAAGIHELLVERAARRVDPELRDLVVHRVATRVGCSWCVDFGTMQAIRAGFTVAHHRELARYRDSDAFSATQKAALEYADAMTDLPMTVTDEIVAGVRECFGEDGLFELTYLISLENMRARTNHALGLTAQGYTSADACPVPFDEQIRRAAPSAVGGASR